MRAAGEPKLRHWVTNFIIEGDGNRANLRCYVMSFNITHGLQAAHVMGEYNDDLVKIDGAWKFQSRRMIAAAGQPSKTS
jgi:hypothetical protein